MTDVSFVTSRAFALGNVPYSISVYRSHEGYTAFCDCHKCESHNMRSSPKPDRDGAISDCEQQIRQHHDEVHTEAVSGKT
jgi:hypothetical protein